MYIQSSLSNYEIYKCNFFMFNFIEFFVNYINSLVCCLCIKGSILSNMEDI